MKHILFLLILIIPISLQAQTSYQKSIQHGHFGQLSENFKSIEDEAGFHLQKAGVQQIGGAVLGLVGTALITYSVYADEGEQVYQIAGIIAGIGSLVLNFSGLSHLKKAGNALRGIKRVSFTGNGIRFNLTKN